MSKNLENSRITRRVDEPYKTASSQFFFNQTYGPSTGSKEPSLVGSQSGILLEQEPLAASFTLSSSPSLSSKENYIPVDFLELDRENDAEDSGDGLLSTTSPFRLLDQSNLGRVHATFRDQDFDQGARHSPMVLKEVFMNDKINESAFCTPESLAKPGLISQKLIKRNHYRTYHTVPSKGQLEIPNLLFKEKVNLQSGYPTPRRKLWWPGMAGERGKAEEERRASDVSEDIPALTKSKRRNTINHYNPCDKNQNNQVPRRRSPRLIEREEQQKDPSSQPSWIQPQLIIFKNTENKNRDETTLTDLLPISSRLRSSLPSTYYHQGQTQKKLNDQASLIKNINHRQKKQKRGTEKRKTFLRSKKKMF
ncbi:hypothetical protein BY996DRAFT_6409628 [Phakopsora pachyrhizi]|uniref:Expressed protein n=1 Tax=Phakopsora pachyrhizi TaxID=170000 RepID=A0AAV0ART8_PHAPC|nr:hypothetical protein BY996DRAFT_6409628 [Phakopsora pachyrhizi]CAH7672058.1 expressed protein [Phakopsora pachyrhizi]